MNVLRVRHLCWKLALRRLPVLLPLRRLSVLLLLLFRHQRCRQRLRMLEQRQVWD